MVYLRNSGTFSYSNGRYALVFTSDGLFDSMYNSYNINGNVQSEPMMFTGYKDASGNDIYVGDLLSKGNIVEFSFGSFNVNGDRDLRYFTTTHSVIGNIHENPELR